MPNQVNTVAIVTHNGVSTNYYFSPKHRGNPTNEVSVWSVHFDDEFACFTSCYQNYWYTGSNGWGLISSGLRQLLELGYNLRSQSLMIAKFVADQNQWHGYPADVRHKPADKPLPQILEAWFNSGYISKARMSRIKQGQL